MRYHDIRFNEYCTEVQNLSLGQLLDSPGETEKSGELAEAGWAQVTELAAMGFSHGLIKASQEIEASGSDLRDNCAAIGGGAGAGN
jgi:hypothetical protein